MTQVGVDLFLMASGGWFRGLDGVGALEMFMSELDDKVAGISIMIAFIENFFIDLFFL